MADGMMNQSMKKCPFCSEEILADAIKCKHCGEWLNNQQPENRNIQKSIDLDTIYNPGYDLKNISEAQKSNFSRHELYSTFPTALVIILHIITLGIFSFFYFGAKHSKFAKIKRDDFGAGEAIGFLFIPFYNIFWIFVFWTRLVDRINFQFKLRNERPPVSKGLSTAVMVFYYLSFIPFVDFVTFPVLILILLPILIGQIQSACNTLAYMGDLPADEVKTRSRKVLYTFYMFPLFAIAFIFFMAILGMVLELSQGDSANVTVPSVVFSIIVFGLSVFGSLVLIMKRSKLKMSFINTKEIQK